jgi:Hsp20/alpha crystallin family
LKWQYWALPKEILMSASKTPPSQYGEPFENEEKEENFHRLERQYGSFSRSFTLPTSVVREASDPANGKPQHVESI